MSKNLLKQQQQETKRGLREGSSGGVFWEFGQIQEVNEENSSLKVIMFAGPQGSMSIGWHPLRKGEGTLRGLQAIYGKLRAGMCCIVHYRGKLGQPKPGSTFIEIIGEGPRCGGDAVIKQAPVANEVEIGPYQIFSGGLLG